MLMCPLPDPDDLIRAALRTVESGTVCVDLSTIRAGTECGITIHRLDRAAVVSVLSRTNSMPSFHQTNVLLVADESGLMKVPDGMQGTVWGSEIIDRLDGELERCLSTGGSGQGDPEAIHGGPVPPRPSVMWTWVSGVARRGVVAVTASSSMSAATNAVVPETGAFVVLLEAPWAESPSFYGTAENGEVVNLGRL